MTNIILSIHIDFEVNQIQRYLKYINIHIYIYIYIKKLFSGNTGKDKRAKKKKIVLLYIIF